MKGLEDLKFTREHEWVRMEDELAVVGITDHAQESLGDVVFVELPEAGDVLEQGDVFGVIESVKTTSDLYAPVGGTIADINEALTDNPAVVNSDCYGEGWMIKIQVKNLADLDKLMSHDEYEAFLAEEDSD